MDKYPRGVEVTFLCSAESQEKRYISSANPVQICQRLVILPPTFLPKKKIFIACLFIMRLISIFVMSLLPIALGLPLLVSCSLSSRNEAELISGKRRETANTPLSSIVKRDAGVVVDATTVLDTGRLIAVRHDGAPNLKRGLVLRTPEGEGASSPSSNEGRTKGSNGGSKGAGSAGSSGGSNGFTLGDLFHRGGAATDFIGGMGGFGKDPTGRDVFERGSSGGGSLGSKAKRGVLLSALEGLGSSSPNSNGGNSGGSNGANSGASSGPIVGILASLFDGSSLGGLL
jgi:hypothetical protein